jgi:hypothetical protein
MTIANSNSGTTTSPMTIPMAMWLRIHVQPCKKALQPPKVATQPQLDKNAKWRQASFQLQSDNS